MAFSDQNKLLASCIAETLIREYLNSYKYDKCLAELAKESLFVGKPGVPVITSRSVLSKELGITKLVKQNKASDSPLPSILEVLVENLLKKAKSTKDSDLKKTLQPIDTVEKTIKQTNMTRHGASQPLEKDPLCVPVRVKSKPTLDNKSTSFMTKMASPTSPKPVNRNDILVSEDVDSDYEVSPTVTFNPSSLRCITVQEAYALRRIIFGNGQQMTTSNEEAKLGYFNEEWKGKGFVFQDLDILKYGLVQLKGGPCGLLAAVQAHIIKYLVFDKGAKSIKNNKLVPSAQQREEALVDSLTDIIWRAGLEHNKAHLVVFIPEAKSTLVSAKYKPDGITERMHIVTCSSRLELRSNIKEHLKTFTKNEKDKHGLIQLLYSAILSRGIDTIMEKDFDDSFGGNVASNTFIGRHGYCTQEMIGLFLLGRAVANVFDGDVYLGENNQGILRGVPGQSDFGYLTLFEHYQSVKVGNYLKSPRFPIYLICSESHFTVMFSLMSIDKDCATFDLYYYDGLANQDEEIRLTIKPNSSVLPPENDLTPPLELCIRTKWKNALVDWNETEPLL